MPISYVGGRTFSFLGVTTDQTIPLTTLTGGSDTAPQAGDFVVVFYGTGSNTNRTLTVRSSYTTVSSAFVSSTTWTNYTGAYKFMGATPDTSVIVSGTGSTADGGAGTIHVFRGVDTTTPLDVTTVTGSSGTTTRPDPGAITPVTAGAWIVAAGAGGNTGGASTTFSSSDLTSFITISSNDTYDVTVGGGIKTDWTSGAFDPAQFTYSGTDSTLFSNRSLTLALRPSPNVTVYPTGVSATGVVGLVYAPSQGTIDYIGARTQFIFGTTSTTNVSLTGLTGGFASAPEDGDLVVVSYAVGAGTAPFTGLSVGSSYTNLSVVSATHTNSSSLVIGYKFMGSTPDTSVTVSSTGSSNNAATVVVQVFRGVDTTTPLDVTSTTASATGSFLANPPSITPVSSGAWVVATGAGAGTGLLSTTTYSSSDLTSFRTISSDDSFDSLIGAGYARWTSGAYDPAAFTSNLGDNANRSWTAYTIALRPVPASNPDVAVSVTGVSATGAVGDVTVTGDANTDATGSEATGQVGDVTVSTGTNVDVPVTGVEATGQVGDVTISGSAVVDATGSAATGQVGDVTVSLAGDVTVDVTGSEATGQVGDVTVSGTAVVDVTGSSATGQAGAVYVQSVGTIDYVGGSTFANNGVTGAAINVSLTALSGGFATAPTQGDLVVVSYTVASNPNPITTINITPGYTSFAVVSQADTACTALVIGYKFMGATPDTTVTVSGTAALNRGSSVTIQVFRGVDPTTPEDVTSTTANAANSFLADPPAITPVSSGAIVVAVGSGAGQSFPANAAYSSSDLTSFLTVFGNTTYDGILGAGYYRWTSGAFDPAAFTANTSSSVNFSWAARTLALRPVPAPVDVTVNVTGVSATGQVGDVVVAIDALADVTGISATGELGDVTFIGSAVSDATGVSATGSVGSVVVIPSVEVLVTGLSASSAVGSVSIIISEIVELTGVFATGQVTGVLVWGPITPSQTAGYAAVAPSQNPGYSPVTPGQTPGWTPVST